MLRIGDFARLGGVSVRALRHYQAEGLLTPAHIDPETGYRRYAFDQLAALDRILALRDLGFSLAEVRALLGTPVGVGDLAARLRRRRAELAGDVERQMARLRRVDALERVLASDPGCPELGARVRPIPDARVLALRARVGSQAGAVTALFEEAEARASRDRVDRSPFLIFHGPRDVEACVPVRSACRAPAVRIVPGAPLVASITYLGSYAQTRPMHTRMVRWLERSGLRPSGPLREVYHRFGADQRGYSLPAGRLVSTADRFVTELQIPAVEVR